MEKSLSALSSVRKITCLSTANDKTGKITDMTKVAIKTENFTSIRRKISRDGRFFQTFGIASAFIVGDGGVSAGDFLSMDVKRLF